MKRESYIMCAFIIIAFVLGVIIFSGSNSEDVEIESLKLTRILVERQHELTEMAFDVAYLLGAVNAMKNGLLDSAQYLEDYNEFLKIVQ